MTIRFYLNYAQTIYQVFKQLQMKTLTKSPLILMLVIFSVLSCNHVSESGSIGDKFYAYLQQEDYDAITRLLDTSALKIYSIAKWKEMLSMRNQYFGGLESYKPVSFHTETFEDYQIIKMGYKVSNFKGHVFEEIRLIKKGNQINILDYRYPTDIVLANKK